MLMLVPMLANRPSCLLPSQMQLVTASRYDTDVNAESIQTYLVIARKEG